MANTKDDGPGFDLLIDGVKHEFRLFDCTTRDALAFREATGTRLVDAFNGPIDLPEIAGLLWLQERRSNPALLYDTVADRLGFRSIFTDAVSPEPDAATPAEDEDDPSS